MRRAAILLGVSTTEGLQTLQAVESGIALMQYWAAGQGIGGEYLIVLTDRNGPLRAYQVADAVDTLVQRRDIDQLIIYFSGHGLHNGGDIWLLSGALKRNSEAVNVEASIQGARSCGISHVVLIADACRIAPEGIQALNVEGIDIFPNEPVDGKERPVDAYFACARGKPALEVRDVAAAARGFSGVYTEVLAECLGGMHADALALSVENGIDVAHLPAWNLADKLEAEVPARLKAKLGRIPTVNQTPVARITSRAGWVSRLCPFQPAVAPEAEVDVLGGSDGAQWSAQEIADRVFYDMLAGGFGMLDNGMLGGADEDNDWGGALFVAMAADLATAPRPGSKPLGCGLVLRGACARALHGPRLDWRIDSKGRQVEVEPGAGPVTVLLELDSGEGVPVSVIPGFLVHLRFKDGELIHLAYEPSSPELPNAAYQPDRSAARALLASIAAAAGLGVLRLQGPAGAVLSRSFSTGGLVDLSLALYGAYAYHDAGRRSRIAYLNGLLRRQFGFVFHDLALLSGRGRLLAAQERGMVLSPVPMLARGWRLLDAFGAELPPRFAELRAHLLPSLWTLFDADGTRLLARAIDDERIAL